MILDRFVELAFWLAVVFLIGLMILAVVNPFAFTMSGWIYLIAAGFVAATPYVLMGKIQ